MSTAKAASFLQEISSTVQTSRWLRPSHRRRRASPRAGRHLFQCRPGPPAAAHLVQELLLRGWLKEARRASARVEQHQRLGALGMRGGEEDRRWHVADDGDLVPAQMIEQRQHVVDDRLDEALLVVGQRIRGTPAPGVEPDVAAERREPVEEVHEAGLVPHVVDGEHRRMNDEHVDRAVSDDLIGDATARRLGEPGLGELSHGQTVCRALHRDARPTDLECRTSGPSPPNPATDPVTGDTP